MKPFLKYGVIGLFLVMGLTACMNNNVDDQQVSKEVYNSLATTARYGSYELKLKEISTLNNQTTYALELCGYELKELNNPQSYVRICTNPYKPGKGVRIVIAKSTNDSETFERISYVIAEKVAQKENLILSRNKEQTVMNACWNHTSRLLDSGNFNMLGTPFMAILCIAGSPVIFAYDSQADYNPYLNKRMENSSKVYENLQKLLSNNKSVIDMKLMKQIFMSLSNSFNSADMSAMNGMTGIQDNTPREKMLSKMVVQSFIEDILYIESEENRTHE